MLAGFLRGVFLEEPSLSRTLQELSQPDKASPFRRSSHPPRSPSLFLTIATPIYVLLLLSNRSSLVLSPSSTPATPYSPFPPRLSFHGDEALIAGSQSGTSIVASKARFHASNNRLAAASSSFSPSSFATRPKPFLTASFRRRAANVAWKRAIAAFSKVSIEITTTESRTEPAAM